MIRKWIKKIVDEQIDDRLMDGIDYDELSVKLSELPDLTRELSEHFDVDDTLHQVADNIDLYDLARHMDTQDVAYHMDACDVAGELDLSDIAYELRDQVEWDDVHDAIVDKLFQDRVYYKLSTELWENPDTEIKNEVTDNFEFDYDKYVIDNESLADAVMTLDGRIDEISAAFEDCFNVIKSLGNHGE